MSGKISNDKLLEVRTSVNIVDLISEYIKLEKVGNSHKGLCPFHDEKTPSFNVDEKKQLYHCFGCHASGDLFSFVMDIERISFPEAIQKVARKGNIDLPTLQSGGGRQSTLSPEKKEIIAAHELLAGYYNHILLATADGEAALKYLLDRGFTKETIEKFKIGFTLNNWQQATEILKGNTFNEDYMEQGGLIIKRDDGSYFDRFRNRIMFPILDNNSKVIAFSGRAFGEDDEPKYLNSPETPIFNKSKTLYNLNLAGREIRKANKLVLLEGFADVISAYEAGVKNSVGTMGTSLTENHIRAIRRLTNEVIICFDGDKAGIEAAYKAAELLEAERATVLIVLLPEGLDPDDYIKRYGSESFKNEIDNALTFMEFKIQYYRRGVNLNNVANLNNYVQKILRENVKNKDPLARELILKQISNEFSISLQTLEEQQASISQEVASKRKNSSQSLNYSEQRQEDLVRKSNNEQLGNPIYNAEQYLLAYMLNDEFLFEKIYDMLEGENLNYDEHQAIYTHLLGFYEAENTADIGSFLRIINDPELRTKVLEIENLPILPEPSEKELKDYINNVFNYANLLKIRAKEKEKQAAEARDDFLAVAKIGNDINEIRKQMNTH